MTHGDEVDSPYSLTPSFHIFQAYIVGMVTVHWPLSCYIVIIKVISALNKKRNSMSVLGVLNSGIVSLNPVWSHVFVVLCFPVLYRLCDHHVMLNEDLVIFQRRGDQGSSCVVVLVYKDSSFICLGKPCLPSSLFIQLCTTALRLIVWSWLDVTIFTTRRLHACHHARAPSSGRWNCGRELSGNFVEMTTSTPFRDLLHAVKLRHGTDGFTFLSKEGVLRMFCPKNLMALAECEPANLGCKGQHATSRPPKPLAYHGNACILTQSVFIKDASIPTVMSFFSS
jgi:hypothetical protein